MLGAVTWPTLRIDATIRSGPRPSAALSKVTRWRWPEQAAVHGAAVRRDRERTPQLGGCGQRTASVAQQRSRGGSDRTAATARPARDRGAARALTLPQRPSGCTASRGAAAASTARERQPAGRPQHDDVHAKVTTDAGRHQQDLTSTNIKAEQKSSIHRSKAQPVFVHQWSHQQLSIEATDTA
jgi:hypothetical protein